MIAQASKLVGQRPPTGWGRMRHQNSIIRLHDPCSHVGPLNSASFAGFPKAHSGPGPETYHTIRITICKPTPGGVAPYMRPNLVAKCELEGQDGYLFHNVSCFRSIFLPRLCGWPRVPVWPRCSSYGFIVLDDTEVALRCMPPTYPH